MAQETDEMTEKMCSRVFHPNWWRPDYFSFSVKCADYFRHHQRPYRPRHHRLRRHRHHPYRRHRQLQAHWNLLLADNLEILYAASPIGKGDFSCCMQCMLGGFHRLPPLLAAMAEGETGRLTLHPSCATRETMFISDNL